MGYYTITTGNVVNAGNKNGQTSPTWNHTVTSGLKKLLVVVRSSRNGGAIASMTFNGVSMTKAKSQGACEIWYLVNPSVGTYAVSVSTTPDASHDYYGSVDFSGVDQTAPVNTTNGASSTASSLNIPFTTNLAGCVELSSSYTNTASISVGGGQSTIFDVDSNDSFASGYKTGLGYIFRFR